MSASLAIALVGAALLDALLAVGAHFLSLRLIFPRPPLKYADGPQLTWLQSGGVRLAAQYWPAEPGAQTLLFLHGNYEDLGSIADYVPAFVRAGYAVFAFDYRGYGLSEGRATEDALNADALRAYFHLRNERGIPPGKIVVFGYSLGGGPAVELARHQPVAGVVLQGAFVSAYRVMTRVPLFPGDKFKNLGKVPQLRCPVLVVHGTDDRTVPVWHGRALFASIRSRKEALFVPGGPHAGLADFAGAPYWDALRQFTASL